MKAKVGFDINFKHYEFEFDEKDEMDTLHKTIVLSSPRMFCNVCREKDNRKYLSSNKDQEGNTYVNMVCMCGAKSKLGRYKTGGYFWKEYELYQKEGSSKTVPNRTDKELSIEDYSI